MHKEYDDQALLYVSGELPPADRERFESHRRGCPHCEELLTALEAGTKAAAAAALSLPEGRLESMAREVLSRPAETRPLTWRRAWGLAAALAVLAVVLYVAKPARVTDKDLAWTDGVETGLAQLDQEIESLDRTLVISETDAEIEEDLGELEEMERQFLGTVPGDAGRQG